MDRKVLAILLILLTGASFLTLGCADRKNAGAGPSITPTATAPVASPTAQASVVPTGVPSATAPAATPGPGSQGTPSGGLNLDPSLADIFSEGDDMTGFPETGLPTPTLD
jgi:hypothetical protein